ncbi:hypothetical protein [Raoultella ornithinolytica]|uniref:hypothetical protein n=1 Tax=Raoultella ornithinolytica TaxID=54291 RepID=UPI0004D870B2|nr:hypothetical protein [Raoultella ornithinolytica]KDV93891.1 putative aldo/keto reductase [Raoultella ornithinolytica 2-156-04_S1_C1]KDX14120.1 putative aldo/keto reductase [Raoultella ornithinolytica 2-156-04_S1_C2]MCZ0883691.1 hypothetical protein [Raoultella ornithinolytica]
MKRQNASTRPERRKRLVARASIAAASLIPHVSATNKDPMRQNRAAAGVSLTAAEMTALTRSLATLTIQGQRLPDAGCRMPDAGCRTDLFRY